MLSYRHEAWWTSGDASFEPRDVAELRVTACELLPGRLVGAAALPLVGCFQSLHPVNRVLVKPLPSSLTPFFLFSFPFYLVGGGVYGKGQVSWLKFC